MRLRAGKHPVTTTRVGASPSSRSRARGAKVTVNRSSVNSRTAHRVPRVSAVAGETEIARAARQLAVDLMRRVDRGADRLEIWWKAQVPRTRVGLAIVVVILGASLLNVVEMRIVQSSASAPAVAQAALKSETTPADAGKVWSVAKMWQGAGNSDTQNFTVSDHWRVDWGFYQNQPVGQLQGFIYSADRELL